MRCSSTLPKSSLALLVVRESSKLNCFAKPQILTSMHCPIVAQDVGSGCAGAAQKGRTSNEDPRVSGKGHPCALRGYDTAGRSGVHQGRGAGSGTAAEVAGGRGEGADSCRRAREGRRREAGAVGGRGGGTCFSHSGDDACDATDRAARTRSAPAAD